MIVLRKGDLPCRVTGSQKLQGALCFLRKFSQVWCVEGKVHSVFPVRKKACCGSGTRTELRTWTAICCSPAWRAPGFERPKEQENKSFSGPHSLLGTSWFPPSLAMFQPISEALSLTFLGPCSTGTDQQGGPREKAHRTGQSCTDLKDPWGLFYILLTVKHRPR